MRRVFIAIAALLPVMGSMQALAQNAGDDPDIRRILENLRKVYEAPADVSNRQPGPAPDRPPEAVPAARPVPVPARAAAPPTVSAALPPVLSNGPPGVPEGEELLVDLKYKNIIAARGLAVAKKGDGVMLPLGETIGSLYLPLEILPKSGRAVGRILPGEEAFELDLTTMRARLGAREVALVPGSVVGGAQDIYVDSVTLGEWLGGTFKVDVADLSVTLVTERQLGALERLAQRRTPGALAGTGPASSETVDVDTPYRVFSWPTIDADLQGSYVRPKSGRSNIAADFNVIGANDFAYFQSQFFAAGSLDQASGASLGIARATLVRDGPSGDLPLKATRIEAGEIIPSAVPMIGRGTFERGLRMSNRPLGFGGRFDATDLIGDAPPGWDVDLFRNGALVATQTATAAGRYSFSNVELFSGNNNFRLVFYGPQGQIREETRIIPLGVGLASEGNFEYDLSLSQQDTPIYNPSYGTPLKAGAAHVNASASYGLGEGLAAIGGVTTFDAVGGRHYAYQSGLVAQTGNWLLVGGGMGDETGGWGYGASAQTTVFDQRLSVNHSFQNGMHLDPTTVVADRTNGFGVSLLGLVPVRLPGPLSYGLTYDGMRTKSSDSDSASLRLSYSYPGFAFSQSLAFARTLPVLGASTHSLDGTTNVFLRLGQSLLRAGLSYNVQPRPRLLSLTAGTRLRFGATATSDVAVDWSPVTKTTMLSAAFDVDVGFARIGPRVSYDNKGTLQFRLGANFSAAGDDRSGSVHLSRDPVSKLGAAAVRVFLDERGDGTYHDGDVPMSGVRIEVPQAGVATKTDDGGFAYVPRLLPGRTVSVLLDEESLGDPALRALRSSVAIRPRSGAATPIDIAVTPAADIEGIVALADPRKPGQSIPQRGVRVDLVRPDGTVADSQMTEFDGLYIFSGVPAGRYRVAVAEADLNRLGAEPPEPKYVDVPRFGGALTLAATELGKAQAAARGFAVMLGEYDSEFGRTADWMLIRPRVQSVARNVRPVEVPAPPEKHALALGPFAKRTDADSLCRNLRTQGIDCSVRAVGA